MPMMLSSEYIMCQSAVKSPAVQMLACNEHVDISSANATLSSSRQDFIQHRCKSQSESDVWQHLRPTQQALTSGKHLRIIFQQQHQHSEQTWITAVFQWGGGTSANSMRGYYIHAGVALFIFLSFSLSLHRFHHPSKLYHSVTNQKLEPWWII